MTVIGYVDWIAMPNRTVGRRGSRGRDTTTLEFHLTALDDKQVKTVLYEFAARLDGVADANRSLSAQESAEVQRRRFNLVRDPGSDFVQKWLEEKSAIRQIAVALSVSGLYSVVIETGEDAQPAEESNKVEAHERHANLALVIGHLLRLCISDTLASQSYLVPNTDKTRKRILYSLREIVVYPTLVKPPQDVNLAASARKMITPSYLSSNKADPGYAQVSTGFLNATEPLLALSSRFGSQIDRTLSDLRQHVDSVLGQRQTRGTRNWFGWLASGMTFLLFAMVFLNGFGKDWSYPLFNRLNRAETAWLYAIYFAFACLCGFLVYRAGRKSPASTREDMTWALVAGIEVLLAAWALFVTNDVKAMNLPPVLQADTGEGTPVAAFRKLIWALPAVGAGILKFSFDRLAEMAIQARQKQTSLAVLDRLKALIGDVGGLRPALNLVFGPGGERSNWRKALDRLPDFKRFDSVIDGAKSELARRSGDDQERLKWLNGVTVGLVALLVSFEPLRSLEPDRRSSEQDKIIQKVAGQISRLEWDSDGCKKANGGTQCDSTEKAAWFTARLLQQQVHAEGEKIEQQIGSLRDAMAKQRDTIETMRATLNNNFYAAVYIQAERFNQKIGELMGADADRATILDGRLTNLEKKIAIAIIGPPDPKPITDAVVKGVQEGLKTVRLDEFRGTIATEIRNAAMTLSNFGHDAIKASVGKAVAAALAEKYDTTVNVTVNTTVKPTFDRGPLSDFEKHARKVLGADHPLKYSVTAGELDGLQNPLSMVIGDAIKKVAAECAKAPATCATAPVSPDSAKKIAEEIKKLLPPHENNGNQFLLSPVSGACKAPVYQIYYYQNADEFDGVCGGHAGGQKTDVPDTCKEAGRPQLDGEKFAIELKNALESAVGSIEAKPGETHQILLAGYADSTGPVIQNTIKSSNRATNLKAWLKVQEKEQLEGNKLRIGNETLTERIAAIGRGEEVAASAYSDGLLLEDAVSRRVDAYICTFKSTPPDGSKQVLGWVREVAKDFFAGVSTVARNLGRSPVVAVIPAKAGID